MPATTQLEPAARTSTGPVSLRACRPRYKRTNHWGTRAPNEFVRYPKSGELPYLHEARLVRRARAGDVGARNTLWVRHLRLVLSVANEFRIPEVLLPDALQEGALGILKAIERFEVERFTSFSTYAWRWVYQCIQRFLVANLFPVRLPSYLFPHYLRFRRELLAAGTPEGERRVYARWRATHRKYYQRLLLTHAVTGAVPVHRLDRAAEPAAGYETPLDDTDWKGLVASGLCVLDDRERAVIALRYGLSGEPALSLEAVGKQFGLTRERVRQIQHKAQARMRRHLADNSGLPYDHQSEDVDGSAG
jgi:RNA polymerase sigma factor (sigma-70 family)